VWQKESTCLLRKHAFAVQAKHRERFFQLADVFLSSSLVPAYTIAAFAKRFARLALTASPAGKVFRG
jgi:U3 small nucleolar RNA-associated protein 19